MNPLVDRSTPTAVRRTWGQRLVIVSNVALIATSLTLAGILDYAGERTSSVNRVELHRSLTEVADAESGGRVINVLLVGSDSSASLDPDDPIQVGRDGERFGDVIIIAHIDERTSDVALLSLPRDLWVSIAGADRSSRINRAFLVGGPALLIDTIEENFGIPIHHYVNVDFAGFQGLVETVGSVEVYFDHPARDWNVNAEPEPRSQTGFLVETAGCHALDPEQALAYVRSRYYQTQAPDGSWQTDPTSDLGRIGRQQDFLQRLLQEAIDQGARNPLVLADLIDTGIRHVAIDQDLTPALLLDLSATYRSFEPGEIESFTYPAIDGTVGANRVLLPQHDEAEELRALFGGRPFTDPATVDVRLLYDSSLDEPSVAGQSVSEASLDEAMAERGLAGVESGTVGAAAVGERLPPVIARLVDELEGVGINDAEIVADDGLARGLWIRHGPDGAQAAGVVAAALAELGRSDVSLVELPDLAGRNVDVVVGPGATFGIGRDSNTDGDDDRPGVLASGTRAQAGTENPGPQQTANQADQNPPLPTRCS